MGLQYLRSVLRHPCLAQKHGAFWVCHLSTQALPSSSDQHLKFCIVGSGPAGFYTLDRLLKAFGNHIHVDVLDRLPTPFGLVRSGVSPDHQDTKNVINQFTAVARDPRASFFGNVALGRDVSLLELRSLYHGVVLAYGAESDKKLGVPGEGGRNVFSAREFVWWYNGHPDGKHLPVDLRGVSSVAVCGIGNVALDCARVLLHPHDELAATDIAAHAMEHIREHGGGIKDVHLLARRGPVQAACTPKELKELVGLPDLTVHAPPAQMEVSAADQAEMKKTRMRRRVYDLIKQAADAGAPSDPSSQGLGGKQRHLHFQFYRSPKEETAGDGLGDEKEFRSNYAVYAFEGILEARTLDLGITKGRAGQFLGGEK
ncbi:hypothetical protein DUNSADRAFT_255 [Dunaliella salina]|uniref:Adrenodoxin-NADP(+) reductase n=1 Tax=Dunaliella salina TaxID=3046 RepID=A0ABQ7FZA0_DUNSA|nr:hypothetical protein DUNSADRAFT_255 [Dunaliella salina]|eukprot:KAF5827676.1 hypothetical protein DUNSADRAFT_255 [Dunaliella salina]